MGERQVYFGALAFETSEALDAALAQAMEPAAPGLAACPSWEREWLLGARRGDRVLVFDQVGWMSALTQSVGSRIWRLAGDSVRGNVVIAYLADRPEISVAGQSDEEWADDPVGDAAPTSRWLPLSTEVVPVTYVASPCEPMEFDVVQLQDGTRALDMFMWAGFIGCLFERGERILFQSFESGYGEDGPVFEWADLARPGSTRLIGYPHKEMLVWVEVRGERAVEFPSEHPRAIEVVVHKMDLEFRADALSSDDWDKDARRETAFWFVEGRGLIAAEERR